MPGEIKKLASSRKVLEKEKEEATMVGIREKKIEEEDEKEEKELTFEETIEEQDNIMEEEFFGG